MNWYSSLLWKLYNFIIFKIYKYLEKNFMKASYGYSDLKKVAHDYSSNFGGYAREILMFTYFFNYNPNMETVLTDRVCSWSRKKGGRRSAARKMKKSCVVPRYQIARFPFGDDGYASKRLERRLNKDTVKQILLSHGLRRRLAARVPFLT